MPHLSFTPTDEITVEFEVFCGTCGAGNCHLADTRNSRRRSMPQVTVEACPTCLKNAEELGRDSRDAEVQELKDRIEELETQLAVNA